MADYSAIYEAGNALVEYLRDVMTPEPVSKREQISLCTPYEPENNQLTVYMYSIEEDPAVMSEGYVSRGYDTEVMSPMKLQAGFLLTAHSNAPANLREADRYRVIGAAIQAIKDMPVLDRKYFTGSLSGKGNEIRLNMDRVSHENLLKIWNNSSIPYKSSIVVRMNGITIDSKRSRQTSRVTEVQIGLDQKENEQ